MKKIVFISIGFCLFIIALFLLVSTNASNSYTVSQKADSPITISQKVYTNKKNGFTVLYPSTWIYREFSEDGVGFQLANEKKDPANEFITIQVFSKTPGNVGIPFSDYVKTAAVNEIQNYQSLASIKPVVVGDITGYKTTWNVLPLGGGKTTISEPITYFPANKNTNKIIEIFLGKKEYLSEYEALIYSFTYSGERVLSR